MVDYKSFFGLGSFCDSFCFGSCCFGLDDFFNGSGVELKACGLVAACLNQIFFG